MSDIEEDDPPTPPDAPLPKKGDSPNAAIDRSIKKLMREMEKKDASPDQIAMKVKVIAAAINWEKVKHHIKDDEEFDPNKF